MKKISIITPCFNAEKSIAETIDSVLGQTALASGRAKLEYIICDGGSTDKTLEIIKSYDHKSIQVVSETDEGMYHALSKGLSKASGDVTAYINAGDYYHKCAFDVVMDIFSRQGIKWLTGYNVSYNEKSYLTGFNLPYRYRRNFFECGMYGTILPFVEQESTFWLSQLNTLIDKEKLSTFKVAGDFYMWKQFSVSHKLHIVEAHLGGFKHHRGQLSEDRDKYLSEMKSLTRKASFFEYLQAYMDKAIWFSYPTFKKILNSREIFRYDHERGEWV